MSYSRYKKIITTETVANSDGNYFNYLLDSDNNYLTSNELVDGYVPIEEIEEVLRNPISRRFFNLYLLHNDESLKENITEQVIQTGNLEHTYQQGQTRSLNISLMNYKKKKNKVKTKDIDEYEYIWNPSSTSGKLWSNTKFKLVLGIALSDSIYWVDEGVFVTQDPDLNNSDANKTVNLQLLDKFALLDGTISGKTDSDYTIPVGSNVQQAIKSLLRLEKDKLGYVYDEKTLIFPSKYANKTTPYTLKKTSGNTIGEIIIELANMLFCDVFYNEIGHLVIKDSTEDLDVHNRAVVWNYDKNNLEFVGVSMKIEWSKIRNKYIVIGSNVNGLLYKGYAENTNPKSEYNTSGSFGTKVEIITDNLINSPIFCEERAKYELKKNAMKYISIKFESIYLPHALPNDLVRWSFEDYGFLNELFIIQSISIPLDSKSLMSISITNIKELPL